MPVPPHLRPALRSTVDELVRGRYALLEQDGRAGRVGSEGLRRAVEEYRRRLIDLPEEAFERCEAIPVRDRPGVWRIDLDLWTVEEGRSDLTLSATVIETDGGVQVSLDDLHVL